MPKPNNQSTTETTVGRTGSAMIERVKYKRCGIKPPAPTSSPTTNDALGAQSNKMQNDTDHQALQNAGVVWQRHQREETQRWQDWTEILGPALIKVQDEAMRVASTDKPEGRRYAKAVSELLKAYQLDQIDGATRWNAIKIVQNLHAVTVWRAEQPKREALNHPSTVWRKFAKKLQSPKPNKKRRAALENAHEPADEKPSLEKSPADPGAKENDDLLGLPNFLNRTPRGALATLLATRKLTVDDVPSDARPAALKKLGRELMDFAAALERRGAEGDQGQQTVVIPSAPSEGLS